MRPSAEVATLLEIRDLLAGSAARASPEGSPY
jgi:hypothetical protein